MSVKRCRFLVLAAAMALPGCMSEYKPAPLPAPPAQKAATAAGQSAPQPGDRPQAAAQPSPSAAKPPVEQPTAFYPPPQEAPGQRPPAGQPPPAAPWPPPSPSGSETAAARQMPIRLSAGVALAQTLDGTAVGFSVDYQFLDEKPRASTQYVWVIERARGKPARIPVRLEQKGNLMLYPRPYWRPEEGPFRAHIEDRSGNRLSESIDLLSPGDVR